MHFNELLTLAKTGDEMATDALFRLYRPLLIKESVVNGVFDEDLYQELCLTMFHCVQKFLL